MAQEIQHRGYRIQGTSYQDEETGRWVPQAEVSPVDEAANWEEGPLTWQRLFATQIEADDFALTGAQLYIDSNY